MTELYNPLTYDNLMAGTVLEFERRPLLQLADDISVLGPGIYCLIYAGRFAAYSEIAGSGKPIYVGRAVPPGSRRGDAINVDAPALRDRLRIHARSIDQASNLDIGDFRCRYLAMEPVWITLAERFTIDHYKPVWNRCLDGFGDNNPGSGRYNGERSWWDTLHPGRAWADNLREVKTVSEALERVQSFFSSEQA
jgi:hypothetical protein